MGRIFVMESGGPLFTNDAVVLGILICILAVIFKTERMKAFKKFYKYVPALLLCYFIPSFFNSLNIISAETSKLYYVTSRFLLPAALILLTISIDLKKIVKLGPKVLIMFFTGTFGIIIGGPLTFIIVNTFFPQIFAGHGTEASWRGMTTIAATWIGGGANQVAMKEVFEVSDYLFSALVTIDVFQQGIRPITALEPPLAVLTAIVPIGGFLLFIQFIRATYSNLETLIVRRRMESQDISETTPY